MSRQLIINLVLPLTVIVFLLFTKWWIVDVVDETDGIMYGFPFIYRAPAFYTSVAQEYFLLELITDFLFYFFLILGVSYFTNKYLIEIRIGKLVSIILFLTASLLIFVELFIASLPENKFSLKRDYDIDIKQTGFEYPFNDNDRKEFDNYYK
jgi:hypothetical protein